MKINTVGIVGYGNFGQFLHELGKKLFPEIEIKVYSRRREIDDETFFSLEEVSKADAVILCAAINEYEERLKEVLEHSLPETIFIDVATVKKYTSELCKDCCEGRSFISTHPMFGPESYKKHGGNVDGFRIVVTDYVLNNDAYQRLKNTFASLGFLIIEMTADEHDKQLAETLFVTHYVGQSILEAGLERTNIDTLSFQFLMDAVESIKGDKRLFADVYKYNPYCKPTAERLHEAQQKVFQELQ